MFPDWIRWLLVETKKFSTTTELLVLTILMTANLSGWIVGLSLIIFYRESLGHSLWVWDLMLTLVMFFHWIRFSIWIKENLEYRTWTKEQINLFLQSDHKLFFDSKSVGWYMKRILDFGSISCYGWSIRIIFDQSLRKEMGAYYFQSYPVLWIFQWIVFWFFIFESIVCLVVTFIVLLKRERSNPFTSPTTEETPLISKY